MDPLTHYLRTFEHLAPTEKVARSHRRKRRTWLLLPLVVVVLAFWLTRPSSQEKTPAAEQAKRALGLLSAERKSVAKLAAIKAERSALAAQAGGNQKRPSGPAGRPSGPANRPSGPNRPH